MLVFMYSGIPGIFRGNYEQSSGGALCIIKRSSAPFALPFLGRRLDKVNFSELRVKVCPNFPVSSQFLERFLNEQDLFNKIKCGSFL